MSKTLMGSLTKAYTAAEAAVELPPLGSIYEDEKGNRYTVLYNAEGASAIAAGVICVSKTKTHREAFGCVIGGQHEGANFAGVRVYGAESLAAGKYGWFQISGEAYVIASTATAATAVDCAAAGAVEDFSASGAQIPFATAGDALSGAVGYIWLNRNVWGK